MNTFLPSTAEIIRFLINCLTIIVSLFSLFFNTLVLVQLHSWFQISCVSSECICNEVEVWTEQTLIASLLAQCQTISGLMEKTISR